MSKIGKRAAEAALRKELGTSAKFARYDRMRRTPMAIVIEEAERELDTSFDVYWVDNGRPVVFCLGDLSTRPVVFSRRYLTLTSVLRQLFVFPLAENGLAKLAEQTTLRLMAEMSLHYGDADFAILAFLRSLWLDSAIMLDDADNLMELECSPIAEPYMVIWFFGLAHELGHLHKLQEVQISEYAFLSDVHIGDLISEALNMFDIYPDDFKQEIVEEAEEQRSKSAVGINHLREEALADIFACVTLLNATRRLFAELKHSALDISQFVNEILIFFNIMVTIERCRVAAIVKFANSVVVDKRPLRQNLLHPVAVAVRLLILREFLPSLVGQLVYGDAPTRAQRRSVESILDHIFEQLATRLTRIEQGLDKALTFTLDPKRSQSESALLEQLRANGPGLEVVLLQRFLVTAKSLGANSRLVNMLDGLYGKPPHTA